MGMGHTLPTLALSLGLLLAVPFAASAQVTDGECPPPSDSSAETLLADLAAIPLAEGCVPVDFKALGKRIKDTEHIGFFAKVKLGLRAKGVINDAKEYDKTKNEGDLVRLRDDYDDLFADFVKKLKNKDPDLTRDLNCTREAGFEVLLKAAALENEKERNGEG